jgi:hypothetical protein
MPGETDLDKMLSGLRPLLLDGDFVFCTIAGASLIDVAHLNPLATYQEQEGLSLLLEQGQADAAAYEYHGVFKGITLTVHSSLDAVGLTAAVASKLAKFDIPANMVAAHYHDHVFVPREKAPKALELLKQFDD